MTQHNKTSKTGIWTDIMLKSNEHLGHQISSSAEGNTAEGPSINPTRELEGSLCSWLVLNSLTPASRSGLRPVSRNVLLNAHHVTNKHSLDVILNLDTMLVQWRQTKPTL